MCRSAPPEAAGWHRGCWQAGYPCAEVPAAVNEKHISPEASCPSILASDLRGIPVVDVDAAAKVGHIRELVLDTRAHQVAGVLVRSGRQLLGRADTLAIPAQAINVAGADALTVRRLGGRYEGSFELAGYPTCAALVGRRILGWSGRVLGLVADVLIDRCTGAVDGYVLLVRRRRPRAWPSSSADVRQVDYVRAARARVGPQMVVAPDGAMVRGALVVGPVAHEPPGDRPDGWGRAVQNCTAGSGRAL
jgi:sporulation protein YlmC with PRC-barrel domain